MHTDPFNFDEVIERAHTNSMKWDGGHLFLSAEALAANPLPMWVADMDFRAPPVVLDALHEAVNYGVFGYLAGASKSYLASVVQWQGNRFGWTVAPEWIVPTSGVITAFKTAVQAFSLPGDSVLIQPPVYAHFHHDILLNGRRLAYAPLARVEDGYRFDEHAFEAAIRDHTRIFLLSNPHNPTGNMWTADELRTMGDICARHNILVIADEIHQDLILNPAKRHVPFASLGDAYAQNSLTCTSPSKTFNLPGLQCANVIASNRRLREAFHQQYDRNVLPFNNGLGMVATEAAYTHGVPWLNALLDYLRGNHAYFAREIHTRAPLLRVLPTDSLYLAWMDCRALGLSAEALHEFMLTKARVWLDQGQRFGAEGRGYMRVNLGCPRATVEEAVGRIAAAVAGLDRSRLSPDR